MSSIKDKGFSLVELLVVIAILGLLALILVPVVGNVRESAHTVECSSNMRQVGLLFHTYASQNNGRLPNALYWDVDLITELEAWDSLEAWQCPKDDIPREEVHFFPDDSSRVAPPRSYITNPFLFNLWGVHPAHNGHGANRGAILMAFNEPQNTWMLTENHQSESSGVDFVIGEHAGSIAGGPQVGPDAGIHGDNVNVVMVDGSIQQVNVTDTETAKTWFRERVIHNNNQ